MNKITGRIIIVVGLLLVGLMNTVFIRVEDINTWKNYVGYLFFLLQ